ncbi:MAG: TIGR03619 family F420-dependent LLM class oxidoreductase [Gammaproteobacteria bacterium]|nr:TIGR03619 family F420-dependent LLM class oxidoreductase [Gammaproteobacteria bacterium]
MTMRFGFVVPNNLGVTDFNALIELAQQAEELGFDSVWVNHHVLNIGYVLERIGDRPYQDPLITLAWIGARTTRIRLGTSVLVMPYLHPMTLAKQAATLDRFCGGRLTLGLGVGSLPEENAALGIPYPSRGRYSDEFLQVLRALWTGESVSFHGEFFNFENILASPTPMQKPHLPLIVAGNRPQALRRAARFGDGWHPMSLPPESVRKRLPVIREEAEKAGRPAPETVQLRIDIGRITAESVAEFAEAGVTDLVMSMQTEDVAQQRNALERFKADIMEPNA